jgi:hypothetical protein
MEMRNGHRESQVIVHIIQPTWRGTNGVEGGDLVDVACDGS